MKNTESKCHAFWKENRNPITMKRCIEENYLHRDNKSPEDIERLLRFREGTSKSKFNFNNQ